MKLISKNTALEHFAAPGPEVLATWCKENQYTGVDPTRTDHVLAAALHYAEAKYPDADKLDICSYAGLVSYLTTGWYGGFGTEQYQKERQAENIIIGLAGGTAGTIEGMYFIPGKAEKVTEEFTHRILAFLDEFYFGDEKKAMSELLSKNALDMIRVGEVLTVSEVAEKYGITTRNVQRAIQKGLLEPDEVAEISSGYLVVRTGANRLWGDKK